MLVIKKFIKNIDECITVGKSKGIDVTSYEAERAILEVYLPKQMSKEEVTAKVNELVSSGITQIGAIMKEFSTLPVDKKMVSEVVKEVIS